MNLHNVPAEALSLTDVAEELATRQAAKSGLIAYAKFMDEDYEAFGIHRLMAAKLEAVENGQCRRLLIEVPPAVGKALAVETVIPTPSGWTTMGELQLGDIVFGPDGKPCFVTAVSDVFCERPVFEVSNQTGDMILADAEHEWVVHVQRDKRSKDYGKMQTLTSQQLWERQNQGARAARLPVAYPLELPEQKLAIPPYVLGYWLGDGDSASGAVTIGPEDQEEALFLLGEYYEITSHAAAMHYGVLGLKASLGELGLIKNKHIPLVYLRSSIIQRLELLQGLIDSDGYVPQSGHIEYCTTSIELAAGVIELIQSLGCRVAVSVNRATLYGKYYGLRYRLTFYMKWAARLRRKAVNCQPQGRPDHYLVLKKAGLADTRCIEVDHPSHEFLAGAAFMPTHNSRLASEFFPSWFLGRNPKLEVIAASYDETLAKGFGREVRNFLQHPRYGLLWPEVSLAADASAMAEWKTNQGGEYKAEGVGGGLIGFHAHVAIIDDPFKNYESALSQHNRRVVWDWYASVLLNRLRSYKNGPGSVIVIMQRWHDDDLGGRIEKLHAEGEEEWDIVRLPSLAEEDDPLGRKPGEALLPEGPNRRTIDELLQIQKRNPNLFMALHQQKPFSDSGDLFRPGDLRLYHKAELPEQLTIYMSSDIALTKGAGDYTVHVIFGVCSDGHIWLLHIWRQQVDIIDGVTEAVRLMKKWQPLQCFFEKISLQKAYGPVLKKHMAEENVWISCIEVSITGRGKKDSPQRAGSIAGAMQMGYVHVPADAHWLGELRYELVKFPNGKFDDQVDALALIGIKLRQLVGAVAPKVVKDGVFQVQPVSLTFNDFREMSSQVRRGKKWTGGAIVMPVALPSPLSDDWPVSAN